MAYYTLMVALLREHEEDDEVAGGGDELSLVTQAAKELQHAYDDGTLSGQFQLYAYSEGSGLFSTAEDVARWKYGKRLRWSTEWEPL